ncbi:MAG: hypothetical protein ACRDJU_03765 [Actinomycetota bacterium]
MTGTGPGSGASRRPKATASASPAPHVWLFKARFRKGSFGWRSQPAIQRVREAVKEIKAVSHKDPVWAADGAVVFLERVSAALEKVDSSSGAIGTVVNHAIQDLVPIIAAAPASARTREAWLDRLLEAHASQGVPYIDTLADAWGDLCGSPEVASKWADELLPITRMVLRPDRSPGEYFHGTPACLSALFRAGRYQEILDVVQHETFWHYRCWGARALAGLGDPQGAVAYAEACRGHYASDVSIDKLCEQVLLESGDVAEAYRRYGMRPNRAGTYLATFRAASRVYPDVPPDVLLRDLVAASPGNEGKWFATAKEMGLYAEAIALASSSPCDPRTLTRAARDLAASEPSFALEAGLLALHWVAMGHGYEVTGSDVYAARSAAIQAGEQLGLEPAQIWDRIRQAVEPGGHYNLVAQVLGRELES